MSDQSSASAALIEQWRQRALYMSPGVAYEVRLCADELEAALQGELVAPFASRVADLKKQEILTWLDEQQRKAERWTRNDRGIFLFTLTGPELNRIKEAALHVESAGQIEAASDRAWNDIAVLHQAKEAIQTITRHAPGYDWNTDPLFLTRVTGDALKAIDSAIHVESAGRDAAVALSDVQRAQEIVAKYAQGELGLTNYLVRVFSELRQSAGRVTPDLDSVRAAMPKGDGRWESACDAAGRCVESCARVLPGGDEMTRWLRCLVLGHQWTYDEYGLAGGWETCQRCDKTRRKDWTR